MHSDPGKGEKSEIERPSLSDSAANAARQGVINARKARQSGSSDRFKSSRKWSFAFILAGIVFLGGMMIGPRTVMRYFTSDSDNSPKTSQVHMEVGRMREEAPRMEFTVPAMPVPTKPEVKKEPDPTLALNERFKVLQAQMTEKERANSAELQKMFQKYNETMALKMEEQRKAFADENTRLREEARRLEELRRRDEEAAKQAAATSKEMAALSKAQRESQAVVVDEPGSSIAGLVGNPVSGHERDLNKNEQFLQSAASSVVTTSVSSRLYDPARMVVQGTIISAVLETAIDTELPGNLRAQVMQPVFSFDGSRVLMQPGTILIGVFNNDVDLEQKRVLIAWNRAITPDGKSVALGGTGTDLLGRSGTLGNVDNRYLVKFGAAALTSAISIVPAMLQERMKRRDSGNNSGNSGTTINLGGSGSGGSRGGSEMAGAVSGSLTRQSSSALDQYLNLPPVIRIPQGEEIRVFVNRDLVFK